MTNSEYARRASAWPSALPRCIVISRKGLESTHHALSPRVQYHCSCSSLMTAFIDIDPGFCDVTVRTRVRLHHAARHVPHHLGENTCPPLSIRMSGARITCSHLSFTLPLEGNIVRSEPYLTTRCNFAHGLTLAYLPSISQYLLTSIIQHRKFLHRRAWPLLVRPLSSPFSATVRAH